MSIRMLVAAHKSASFPADPAYIPIQVGRASSDTDLGYVTDATGENISRKNDSYCELTAVFWAWKSLPDDADAVGLSHYRRYFRGSAPGPSGSRVLSGDEMSELMSSVDVVIARPRNYVVETVESHYRHGHFGEDLDILRAVIEESFPAYSESLERVLGRRTVSLYNMFLMRREPFVEYCAWLFSVLGEVEGRIENNSRDSYQRRTFGYLGERLLNVWVAQHESELRVSRRGVINTDGEPKFSKGVRMIRRKVGL